MHQRRWHRASARTLHKQGPPYRTLDPLPGSSDTGWRWSGAGVRVGLRVDVKEELLEVLEVAMGVLEVAMVVEGAS